jgi:mannosyltransferase
MTTRRLLPAAVFVLLLATFTRFHLLEAQSFWNDEGNSARLSERSIPAIIAGTASDIHPPLYYLALRGWRELVGETEFGLRSLSAFAGVVTVAIVIALGRNLSQGRKGAKAQGETNTFLASSRPGVIALNSSTTNGRKLTQGRKGAKAQAIPNESIASARPGVVALTSAVAGLLAAVSPVLVYYSQETRMYALLALLAALSAWVLLVWLGGARRPWFWMAAYTLLLAAGLYTHYFFPAVVAAQGVVVGLWWLVGEREKGSRGEGGMGRNTLFSIPVSRFSSLVSWVGMAAVAALFYAPWIPIFLRQIGGRGAPAGPAAFAAESARWLALGGTVAPGEAAGAVVAFIALVILGAVAGARRSAVALVLAFVPLVLMFFVGATDPAFFKFMLAVAPLLAVLAGLAWKTDHRPLTTDHRPLTTDHRPWSIIRRLWPLTAAALTVAVIAGSLLSLGNLYHDPAYARADYRRMAARIAADGHPNAGIILVAPNQWEAFTYYYRDGAPVYPLPRGRPDPALLEPELAAIAAAHNRLYVLYWGETQRDPEGIIERWLDANTFKASEEWVGDVRFAVYATAGEAPVMTPGGATFAGLDGETITMHEFAVWPREAQPGDVIQARLLWSADATPLRPYKVFLHLLDEAGNVVAQRDGEPGGGSRPTTGWAAGEQVIDNHGLLLPPTLPPGRYSLRLGLYDAFDPATRLAVGGGDGLALGEIAIR